MGIKILIVKKLLLLLSLVLPTFMVSCMNREAGDSLSIPYVREVLSDTTSLTYRIIADGCPDRRDGTIAVVGQEFDVFSVARELVNCDYFDNVDGHMRPDGLPDFAGETISMICDNANEPYQGYLDNNNENYLKELSVKNFISAVDTTCALNPFDRKTNIHKTGSKIVILASSYSSAFGYDDVMRLVKSAGSDIAVISPVHSMFNYAVRKHSEKGCFGVWTTQKELGAGIYSIVKADLEKIYPGLEYDAFCPVYAESLKDRILSFLEMYKEAGKEKVLDAVIVDEAGLKADDLNGTLQEMISKNDGTMMKYIDMVSENFEFIDARRTVVADCIAYLRDRNLFTHKVAYPALAMYTTVPASGLADQDYNADGSLSDSFKYNRAENSDFETYLLMEKLLIPTTFDAYVPK